MLKSPCPPDGSGDSTSPKVRTVQRTRMPHKVLYKGDSHLQHSAAPSCPAAMGLFARYIKTHSLDRKTENVDRLLIQKALEKRHDMSDQNIQICVLYAGWQNAKWMSQLMIMSRLVELCRLGSATRLLVCGILGACEILRIKSISFVTCPSVRPSAWKKKLGSHWTDFSEILYLRFFSKVSRKNSSFIKIWQEHPIVYMKTYAHPW